MGFRMLLIKMTKMMMMMKRKMRKLIAARKLMNQKRKRGWNGYFTNLDMVGPSKCVTVWWFMGSVCEWFIHHA